MNRIEHIKQAINTGKACLGIELGSTRIKAVLVDEAFQPIATGSFAWENSQQDGVWTYGLEEALSGVRAAYLDLAASLEKETGLRPTQLAGIGVSAMMHGYLAFDEQGELLVPFRTWRNTMTAQASEELTGLLGFAVPQRWSVAHFHQALLKGEEHIKRLHSLNTLAGYVHERLTGTRALGVGDASGMFPLDGEGRYDRERLDRYNERARALGFNQPLENLLPPILQAGENAGVLSPAGAALLDTSGALLPGIPFSPPEGDAGTGMVATNAVLPRTGNVSAGTSIFAMIVLERPLKKLHPEIDIVATPAGNPVAMVHCNNCTTDLNNWVAVFGGFLTQLGLTPERESMYKAFFDAALEADADAGGVLTCGYYSGEHITGFTEGRPFLAQVEGARFTFQNLARSVLLSALATLSLGMRVLDGENVRVDRVLGHGGLYKSNDAGQRLTAAALNAPVSVMETAGEGGAWGSALLAAYMAWGKPGESLGAFLQGRVFASMPVSTLAPDKKDFEGFKAYLERFVSGLAVEKTAVEKL